MDSKNIQLSSLLSIRDFKCLPISLPGSSFIKYIFFRPIRSEYKNIISSKEDYRTIYVTNLDPNCREDDLRNLFSTCGAIETIMYLTNFKIGYFLIVSLKI